MVRNKKGGSGHKKMARKNVAPKGGYTNRKLRLPKEEGEIIARVIAISGGGHAVIKCTDGKERTLVIRGKFRGRNKRDNTIKTGCFVLAGLRSVSMGEVVNPKKKEKADILEVYPESSKKELLSRSEVYALLDDRDKEELNEDGPFEFSHQQVLDTTQENIKVSKKSEDLFKKEEEEFDWDDI